jgi:cytochrome b involved in lipid metabolism
MKKVIILILIIAAIVGTVIYLRKDDPAETANTNNPPPSNQENSNQAVNTPTPESNPNVKTYTMEEVRKHGPESWDNGDSSPLCWMVIHGKVYEIPDSFTETHPGGHVIYDGCGTDATTYFETRPQGSGTPHSANARSILEKYYIGDLQK